MPVQQFTVNVRSRVDRALRRDLVRSAIAANRLTAATLRAQLATRRLGASQRFLARRLAYTARAFRTTRAAMFGFGTVLTGFAGYSIIRAIDNITRLENRLRTAGIGGEEANRVIDHLNDTANETGGNIAQLAAIFGRFVFSLKDTTSTTDEVVVAVRSLARSATAMGITAQEARGGLIQLSQGLASGRLQGEELRSVLETIPTFARQLSTTVGVSYGQIREEARLGRISIQQMRQAFVDFEKTANAQFANFRLPIFGAISALFNELGRLIEEIARRLGAKEGISGAIQSLTQIVKNMRLALDDTTSSFSKFFGVIIVGVQGAFRTLVAFIEEFLFFSQEAFLRLELVLQGLIASIRSAFEGDFAGAINTLEATFEVGIQSFVSGFDDTTKAAKGTAAAIRNVLKYGYKFGKRRNIVATPLPKTPPPVPNLPLIQRARQLSDDVTSVTRDLMLKHGDLVTTIARVPLLLRDGIDDQIASAEQVADDTAGVVGKLLDVNDELSKKITEAAEAPAERIAETTKALNKEIKEAEKLLEKSLPEFGKTDEATSDLQKRQQQEFRSTVANYAQKGADSLGGQGGSFSRTVSSVGQGYAQGGGYGATAAFAQAVNERSIEATKEFENLNIQIEAASDAYDEQAGIEARARIELEKTTRGTAEYRQALQEIGRSTFRRAQLDQELIKLEGERAKIDKDVAESGLRALAGQDLLNDATNELLEAFAPVSDVVAELSGLMAKLVGAIGRLIRGILDGLRSLGQSIGDWTVRAYRFLTLQDDVDPAADRARREGQRQQREDFSVATAARLGRAIGNLAEPDSAINQPISKFLTDIEERLRNDSLEKVLNDLKQDTEGIARGYGFSDPEAIRAITQFLTNPMLEFSKAQIDILNRVAFGVEEEVDATKDIAAELRKNQESLEFLLAERDRRNAVLRAQLAEERRLEGERRERAVSAVGPGGSPATPITINNLINGGMLVDEINSGAGEAAILNVINSNREQVRDVLASAS